MPSGSVPCPARVGELQHLQLAALDVVAALQAGCGRDQQGRGLGAPRAHQGEVAGVVARRDLLLVGGVLLFVHHQEPEVGDRGEERRARAEDHTRLPQPHPLPLLLALAGAEPRVQDRQALAEALLDRPRQRRHQRDLGHQQDHRAAGGERLVRRAQVDLGLARAGHALEQQRRELPALDHPVEPRERAFLVGAQADLRRSSQRAQAVAVHGEMLDLGELAHHAELHQAADHRRGALHGRRHLGDRRRPADRGQVLDHGLALRRAPDRREMGGEAAGRQLHGRDVARRPRVLLLPRDPAALGHPGEHRGEVGEADLALKLGDRHPPALAQGVDHRRLPRSARRRERAGVGQPDAPVAPGRQVGRQHGAEDLSEGGHVVLGGEAGELDQVGREDRLDVDHLLDRPQGDPLGALVVDADDDAGQPPLPHPGAGAHPRLGQGGQRRRQLVGEGIGQRERQRQVDEQAGGRSREQRGVGHHAREQRSQRAPPLP